MKVRKKQAAGAGSNGARARRRIKVESDEPKASSRWGHLSKVAAEFKDFKPAAEVLRKVQAMPTIFPDFDLATRVGGLPLERITLVHGPSAGGKSYVCLGLMRSFLERDQPVYFVDAERTTPEDWVQHSLAEMLEHPLFKMEESTSYENTVAEVRKFLLAAKRTKTNALVVVDSIRKLVPRDQLKNMMKGGSGADENVRNRSAQIKAQMNAAWLDELVVLLSEARSAMVIVAREIHDADAPPAFKKFGNKEPAVKTAGGAALFYDASLDLRVSRIKAYGKKGEDSFETYGDMHQISITKSKVAGKDTSRYGSATFHVSNGAHTPKGFDRARDLVTLARRLDVIEGTQALKWKGKKWRGEDRAIASLVEDVEAFAGIEAECRALFPKLVVR